MAPRKATKRTTDRSPSPVGRRRSMSPSAKPRKAASSKEEAGSSHESELAQRIDEEKRRTDARHNLKIYKRPLTTLYLFGTVTVRYCVQCVDYLLERRLTVLLPAFLTLVAYLIGSSVQGPHTPLIDELEISVSFVIWWVGLGILSSIGLGTGMHSGMLFVFPFILQVCKTAERCSTLHFDSRILMWGNGEPIECPGETSAYTTYLGTLLKVLPVTFLWGLGTAVGEIPPYAVSKAAAIAGHANEELDGLMAGEHDLGWHPSGLFLRMQKWMINILQKHGFAAVVALSAWPNAAFDVCGMCCGHFMMPFWTFLGGTIVGKAVIKSSGQAAVFTMAFRTESRSWFVGHLKYVLPDSIHHKVDEKIAAMNDMFSGAAKPQQAEKAEGLFSFHLGSLWNLVVLGLVGFFIVSCIEQFAQAEQAERDKAEMDKRFPKTLAARKKPVKQI